MKCLKALKALKGAEQSVGKLLDLALTEKSVLSKHHHGMLWAAHVVIQEVKKEVEYKDGPYEK